MVSSKNIFRNLSRNSIQILVYMLWQESCKSSSDFSRYSQKDFSWGFSRNFSGFFQEFQLKLSQFFSLGSFRDSFQECLTELILEFLPDLIPAIPSRIVFLYSSRSFAKFLLEFCLAFLIKIRLEFFFNFSVNLFGFFQGISSGYF